MSEDLVKRGVKRCKTCKVDKPLASFDVTDPDQFVEASHISNLQPLWHLDNLAKGTKIMTQDEARCAYKGPK